MLIKIPVFKRCCSQLVGQLLTQIRTITNFILESRLLLRRNGYVRKKLNAVPGPLKRLLSTIFIDMVIV